MARLLIFFVLSLCFAGASSACEIETENRADNVADYFETAQLCLNEAPGDFRYSEAMEREFIDLINQERAARGLEPLILRQEMRPAARFHSLDMGVNDFFGHLTPDGRGSTFRISVFDRTLLADTTAENVARLKLNWECSDQDGARISCADLQGLDTDVMAGAVDQIHKDLMASSGHRDNILTPDATHIALGVARTDSGIYVTQLFARPIGAFLTPVPIVLEAGGPLTTEVEFTNDLSFTRFALLDDEGMTDLEDGEVPLSLRGDVDLAVRGEAVSVYPTSNGQTQRGFSFMYVPGPAVTVVASDASTGS
ncbi:MAG: CAP domain-containing protein [Pseudomonadota bacterium]